MSKLIPIFACLVLASFIGSVTSVCTCPMTNFNYDLTKSTYIFTGTVTNIVPIDATHNYVYFNVMRWFKGTPTLSTFRIIVPTDINMCPINFLVGKRYLVWVPSNLIVTSCTRTRLLSRVLMDFDRLMNLLLIR